MHELSLCEQVLELIQQQARSQHFQQVKTVHLEIGKLSCVEAEAMRFCFDSVVAGSLAEGALLEIDQTEATAWCPACEQLSRVEQRYEACPCCGHVPLDIRAGEQMRIKYLEVL